MGEDTAMTPLTISPARTSASDRRRLEFVEVTSVTEQSEAGEAAEPLDGAAPQISEPRWNLWGDAER